MMSLDSEFHEFIKSDANEILPGLWVGNAKSCEIALSFGFKVLCVHENPQCCSICHKIIINRSETRPYKVDPYDLDMVTEWLKENWKFDQRVLVHCQGGRERSPMAVAWALTQTCLHNLNFSQVYDFVLKQRPVACNRAHWIQGRKIKS